MTDDLIDYILLILQVIGTLGLGITAIYLIIYYGACCVDAVVDWWNKHFNNKGKTK
jgi:hypothetical protein